MSPSADRRIKSFWILFRISRYNVCTVWMTLALLSLHIASVRTQIEDIILDLEDPEDYVEEVVANLEREQAARERQQVEAAARCRVRCLANRQILELWNKFADLECICRGSLVHISTHRQTDVPTTRCSDGFLYPAVSMNRSGTPVPEIVYEPP
ncbi:hypothetical protein LSH36_824g02019 [Paralvinella palmiformis]|uniref:Uncharacterized protein n=1 Tax=Paralvinella palmiformis TaxID=53620 RepID=A0AAD9IZU1_9ANNE|nr:hypothetical protein LSH36_824g02019 [Paralvinella palmiformis]